MNPFERDLKKAAEMYVDRTFDSDIPSEIDNEMNDRILKFIKEDDMTNGKKHVLKKSVKAALICAAVITLSVVVCAAAPAVRDYLNMVFLQEDSEARIAEVPEGYIGIYTSDDLNNVRNDLHANYIMMNDIVITEDDYAEGGIFEGGFEPIGDAENAFTGIFNGNGYVIDGLVIDIDDAGIQYGKDYIGLFGNCERYYPMQIEKDGKTYTGTGEGYGIIKNLGLTNGKIDVKTNEGVGNDLSVGSIAGHVDYLVGCFAENMEITVTNAMNSAKVYVGGLAGDGHYIDSCYAIADINVSESYTGDEELRNTNYTPYVGGIAGYSNSCVTSYFDGQINSGGYESNGITTLPQYNAPWMLTETIMDEILSRLDDWNRMKFNSFYVLSEYHFNEILTPQVYVTEETELVPFYFLDPLVKDRELVELDKIIESVFPDGSFEEFCIENDLKTGIYYCYDLRNMTECDFEGFDFDHIWTREGHKNPTLRLFAGGSVEIDEPNSFKDRMSVGKFIFSK